MVAQSEPICRLEVMGVVIKPSCEPVGANYNGPVVRVGHDDFCQAFILRQLLGKVKNLIH